MKLDSQLNVYIARSDVRENRRQRLDDESNHSKKLYHRYLEIYQQNRLQDNDYEKMDERQNLKQTENKEQNNTLNDFSKENRSLREHLDQALSYIVDLKNQLNLCRQELEQLRKINTQNQIKITYKKQYILQQLQALLQNKSLLDEQVYYLKSQIQNKIQSQPQKIIQQSYSDQNSDKSRQKQFIRSIQGMYQSIQGIKQTNLIVIWRWLKQITLSYTRYIKWRKKNQKKLINACLQPLLASTLLSQLKLIH